MLKNSIILISIFLLTVVNSQSCKPWGLRIYLGDSYMNPEGKNDVKIVFNTDDSCSESFIELNGQHIDCYNRNTTIQPIKFNVHSHTCVINIKFSGDVYKANYTAIGLSSKNQQERRETIQMRVPKRDISSQFDTLIIGDWGELDDQSRKTVDDILPHVQKLMQNPKTLLGLFLGDLAYDLCDQYVSTNISCKKYKPMLIAAQLITSRIALMPTLGNHQYAPNHLLSKQLIQKTYDLPYQDINQYSFEVGNIKFQAFNPYEQIFQSDKSKTNIKVQTLIEDNKNKSKHIQWVIPFSHYPVYCKTYDDNQQCVDNSYNKLTPQFINYYYDYGVKLQLGAHIHQYRRTKPINRGGQTGNFKQQQNGNTIRYTDLNNSIIYVIQGAAGNSDFVDLEGAQLADYEQSQVANAGYMIMTSSRKSKDLTLRHYYGKNGTIADQFTIVSPAKQQPQWKIVVILAFSQLFFFIAIAVMVILACRHKPVRQHSTLTDHLIQNSLEV